MSPSDYLRRVKDFGKVVKAKVEQRNVSREIIPLDDILKGRFCIWRLSRNHPVGHFLEGFVSHIDRSSIQLFACARLSNNEDELTQRLKPHFVGWRNLCGVDDATASE